MNNVHAVWERVDKRRWNQCWQWTGYTNKGYGRLDIAGVEGVYAHRAAYISANPSCGLSLKDDSDKDRCVLHSCDNPSCCNPHHMFIGSHDDNMDDKVSKGRSKIWEHSTQTPRAKLTTEDVQCIRMQKKQGAAIRALCMLYGVSPATIKGVTSRRHYKDVR